MDIENMQAGREMDALVAKLIFSSRHPGPPPDVWPRGLFQTGDRLWQFSEEARDWIACPFSTDISAAWRVVQVYDPEYNVKLYNHGDGWTFVIYKDATHYEADALTPELAICRAALKSLASKAIAPARGGGV